MRHLYCHQHGFLDARRNTVHYDHEASVIIEHDGTVSKNRYGIAGVKLDYKAVGILYGMSLNQIEKFFKDLTQGHVSK